MQKEMKHEGTLVELKKMFAYLMVRSQILACWRKTLASHRFARDVLFFNWNKPVAHCSFLFTELPARCFQESERKAYNPRSFCKVYTMDKQPLNTGEQKDMVEFFTDLITKLEEMGPELVSGIMRTTLEMRSKKSVTVCVPVRSIHRKQPRVLVFLRIIRLGLTSCLF